MKKQYRQGDVLLIEIDKLPKNVKKLNHRTLAYGEVTGHSHRAVDGELYEDETKNLFLQVAFPTEIIHEEHRPIELPAGNYAVIRQREYTKKDMTRLVVD